MRYLSEFRAPVPTRALVDEIARHTSRPWTLMEVCGGQTHSILRYGLDQLLPDGVELVHGPGCPVCVTPSETVDLAVRISEVENVVFCSFGDMLRVPGTNGSLLESKARGHDVRVVYSPMDALEIARSCPEREVVFFAVGFETTAPANAMLAYQARAQGISNLSLLVAHVRVPPAMESILASPDNRIQGFLAAGHVCTVMGYREYEPISEVYKVPIVVTGFEPVDILEGVYLCIRELEAGRHRVRNQYRRSVKRAGNDHARQIVEAVFEVQSRDWRGLGRIPDSGLRLRPEFSELDAEQRFSFSDSSYSKEGSCISGEILRGLCKPTDCPVFGTQCTPETPLGAPMVSSEGACAAYYHYRQPMRSTLGR